MNWTFVCVACGREQVTHVYLGCTACEICTDCTPNAGRCLDCADMRHQDTADLYRRHQQETP